MTSASQKTCYLRNLQIIVFAALVTLVVVGLYSLSQWTGNASKAPAIEPHVRTFELDVKPLRKVLSVLSDADFKEAREICAQHRTGWDYGQPIFEQDWARRCGVVQGEMLDRSMEASHRETERRIANSPDGQRLKALLREPQP